MWTQRIQKTNNYKHDKDEGDTERKKKQQENRSKYTEKKGLRGRKKTENWKLKKLLSKENSMRSDTTYICFF